MGESRGSEQMANSPDRRVAKQNSKDASVGPGGSKQTRGVFRGSRTSRFLQKATLALGIAGAAAVGGEKVGLLPQTPPKPVEASRDITLTYDKNGNLVNVVDKRVKKPTPAAESSKAAKNNDEQKIDKSPEQPDPLRTLFPNATGPELAQIYRNVQRYKGAAGVGTLEQFPTMKFFLAGWGDQLESEAKKKGVDPLLPKSLVFIESRGDREALSDAGAFGTAQLMKNPAVEHGLRVDAEVDERGNPYLSNEAMITILSESNQIFNDLGLVVWSYHAGVGNVMSAVAEYFDDDELRQYDVAMGMETSDLRLALEAKAKRLIEENKVNFYKLTQNKRVRENVLSKLGDDTENYVYKAIAAMQNLQNLN